MKIIQNKKVKIKFKPRRIRMLSNSTFSQNSSRKKKIRNKTNYFCELNFKILGRNMNIKSNYKKQNYMKDLKNNNIKTDLIKKKN